MALVEAWLSNRLKTFAGLAQLVAARVYPIIAPEGTDADVENPVPYIVFTRASTTRTYVSGQRAGSDGLPVVLFHIDCWCRDYSVLKSVEDQCRLAIDGYRQDADGFTVRRAFIKDEYDIISDPQFDEERPTFGARLELEISHTEQLAT